MKNNTLLARAAALLWLLPCLFPGATPAHAASLGTWPVVDVGKPAKIFVSGVAYGAGRWVAVGQAGYIATSTDGVKWARKSAGITRDFNDVCYTGHQFIAVCKAPDGPGAKIWVSVDGSVWKPRDTDASGDAISQGLHAVAADDAGNVIAVGGISGQMTRSFDHGQTWHRVLPGDGQSWPGLYAVCHGQGMWLCGGFNRIMKSTDNGATWSDVSTTKGARDICFGNNRWFVADFWNNQMLWSVNGSTWNVTTRAPGHGSGSNFTYVHGCTYADGLFIGVTEYGDIWTSETGREVQQWRAAGGDPDVWAVAGGSRRFLAVGGDYTLKLGMAWASPPWLRARLGGPWDHPYTAFDAEDGPPRKIALPEYRVNTASLNLHLEGTLFHMPTLAAAVRFRLNYTSQPVEDGASEIGPFGKNWRCSYESVLGSFGKEVRLLTGGGNAQVFATPDGQDLSTLPPGPIVLAGPAGSQDELTWLGAAQGFKLLARATRTTYRYATSGGPGNALWFLTRVEDRNGNALVLNVTPNATGGRLNTVTDPAGRQIQFTYNTDGRCTRLDTPDGRAIIFSYDSQQNLAGITDMAGYHASYVYDELGFLKRMNTEGRITRFAWAKRPGYEDEASAQDNAGDKIVSSVTTSTGGVIKYELLTDGGVKRTDARGTSMVFNSEDGRTTSIQGGKGARSKVAFNEQKLPSRFTDEQGQVTDIQYDAKGRPVEIEDALGNTTTFTYDARGNLLSRTDPLGKTWQFTYDANDNLATTRTPLNHVTTHQYHANGRLWKTMDPRGGTTENLYNAAGDLTSQTDAAGNTATYTYDGVGRCTGMTDRAGRGKTLLYDNNDRITQLTYGGGQERQFLYDAFGQTAFTDEMGATTSIQRNDFGYITRLTDPMGHLTLTDYNPENLPERITDPLGRVTTTAYDADGRPVQITDPLGRKTVREYNAQGGLVKLTDARKAATSFEYDDNDRLVGITDPLGKKVTHERDALGRVTTTTNARGEKIRVTYDDDGRITQKETRAATAGAAFVTVATSTFDANNNLVSRTDPAGTTTWAYDAANRATSATWQGGTSAHFTYTATGQPATLTYPGGMVVTYLYDTYNRQKVPSPFRSGEEVIGAQEPGSNVTGVSISLNGETVNIIFQYDAAGRLLEVDRNVLPAGPGSIHTTHTYDPLGRPTRIKHDLPAGTAFDWQLNYDAVGNVVAETHEGGFNTPPLLPAPATFTYDLGGRIKTRSGAAHTYDADGNLTSVAGGAFTALYSAENKPVSITRAGATTTHLYDGSGMRARRQEGAAIINYHYGPGGRLLFTTDGTGAVQACYVWGDRGLLCAVKGASLSTGLRHYLTGRLMSVTGLTDAAGVMLATYAYDPLGGCARTVAQPGFVDDNPFTFVGGLGVLDEGDGLYYMRQRFYDADTGRFLQKDPAGFEGGINLYAYAAGNPVNSVDPAGTWDVNWSRLAKGVKQLAMAGVGIGIAAVSAPVSGPVMGTLAAVAVVNTVLSGSAGICNVVVSVASPNDTRTGETLDQVDSFGKVLGMGAGATYTALNSVVKGTNVDPAQLEKNMKTGSTLGSTVDLAANGTRWNIPDAHVLNTLDRICTADSVGQAYGESAAVIIKESQSGETPAPQANAPVDDSDFNWGGNE